MHMDTIVIHGGTSCNNEISYFTNLYIYYIYHALYFRTEVVCHLIRENRVEYCDI
jgi:hypothetical protein